MSDAAMKALCGAGMGLGPLSEAGVGLDCQECAFQTADERKADAHYALTGHSIAIDYIDHESEWPKS